MGSHVIAVAAAAEFNLTPCYPEEPPAASYSVTIEANGTLSNASAPIQHTGSTYRLTRNWSGTVRDDRNGSTFDGGGYALTPNTTGLIAFRVVGVNNLTITNLTLLGGPPPHPFDLLYLIDTANVSLVQDVIGNASSGVAVCIVNGTDDRASQSRFDAEYAVQDLGSWRVSLANCTLTSATVDLYGTGLTDTALRNNSLDGPGQWILLYDSTNFSEMGDSLNDTHLGPSGIYADGSSRLLWADDAFKTAFDLDLLTVLSGQIAVQDSQFLQYQGGGYFADSCTAVQLNANRFESSNATSIAINLDVSGDTLVDLNQIAGGGTGVWAAEVAPLSVENNTISNAAQYGLNLSRLQHPVVTGNYIAGAGILSGLAGVRADNVTELVLVDNQIADWAAPGSASLTSFGLEDSRIHDNILDGSWFGVYFVACYFDTLLNNQIEDGGFTGNGSGLWFYSVGGLNVSHNDLEFAYHGLWATYGGDSVFYGDDFNFEQGVGLRWQSFFNLTFGGDSFSDDPTGALFEGGAALRFVGNDGSDPSGTCGECNPLYLYNDVGVVVADNNLSNSNVAIDAGLIGNASFRHNLAYGSGFLLLVGEGFNVSLQGNIGSGNVEGIEVDNCTNLSISANQIAGPIVGGIRLFGDSPGAVNANTVVNGMPGAFGLEVSYSSLVTATNNTLSNLSVGTDVDNSSGVSFTANTIGADSLAFELSNSGRLSFVHNNFESDRGYRIDGPTRDSGAISFNASYPVGGNFWSNHTSPDTLSGPAQDQPGPDNIVDHPFPLLPSDPGLTDAFPLATPWAYPSIEVDEKGLPPATEWTVSLEYGAAAGGAIVSAATSGTSVLLGVPYAARTPFELRVGPLPGYVAMPRTVPANTTPLQLVITVNFAPYLSLISFQANGLPPNTSWSVVVDNQTLSGSGGVLNVSLANGTYAYAVPAPPGYHAPAPGTERVIGRTAVVTLNFTPFEFAIIFLEYGLANGTDWTLTFLGSTYTQASRALEFVAPNGSYAYRLSTVGGYTLSATNGTVHVAGRDVAVQAAYVAQSTVTPPQTPASPSSVPIELGLAALAVVSLVLGMLLGRRRRPPPGGGPPEEAPTAPAETSGSYYDAPPP